MNATSRFSLSRQKLFWLILATLTVLATILRTVALMGSMDEIGYFQKGSLPVALFYATVALIALGCVTLFFLISNKDASREPVALPRARFVSAAIAAVTLAATALFLAVRMSSLPTPTLLNVLTALTLLCGAVYFALRLTAIPITTTALWGYGAILSLALSLILTYFDQYVQMNAPHKLSFHVCMILAMIALLLELRDLLDRPFPRFCVALTALAAAFCTATALPNLIAFLGGVYSDVLYLFFDMMTLGVAVYFGTKCVYYALSPAKEVPDERG